MNTPTENAGYDPDVLAYWRSLGHDLVAEDESLRRRKEALVRNEAALERPIDRLLLDLIGKLHECFVIQNEIFPDLRPLDYEPVHTGPNYQIDWKCFWDRLKMLRDQLSNTGISVRQTVGDIVDFVERYPFEIEDTIREEGPWYFWQNFRPNKRLVAEARKYGAESLAGLMQEGRRSLVEHSYTVRKNISRHNRASREIVEPA